MSKSSFNPTGVSGIDHGIVLEAVKHGIAIVEIKVGEDVLYALLPLHRSLTERDEPTEASVQVVTVKPNMCEAHGELIWLQAHCAASPRRATN